MKADGRWQMAEGKRGECGRCGRCGETWGKGKEKAEGRDVSAKRLSKRRKLKISKEEILVKKSVESIVIIKV
jgi:uncharacterized membrane protein YvbJ